MLGAATILLIADTALWLLTMAVMLHYGRLKKLSRTQTVANTGNRQLPPVSLIVVAQEQAEQLREHLPAFLRQQYPTEFQVIVADIHSSDGTLKLMEEMELQYPNLTHTSVPASARDVSLQRLAMTLGLRTAFTEWVVFTQADCVPESDDWLARFMSVDTAGKNAILGMTRYAACPDWFMQKCQFFRLWQQMLWLPFATKHRPYRADDTLFGYRREHFIGHQGFASDSRLLAGASTLLVNHNILPGQCTVSVGEGTLLVQDNPMPHTWHREQLFFIETRRHTLQHCLYRTWYAVCAWLPILFTLSSIAVCIAWIPGLLVVPDSLVVPDFLMAGLASAMWLAALVTGSITFNSTAKQFGIRGLRLMFPVLSFMIPHWDASAWLRWCFTDKRTFRKKFV